MAFDSWQSLVGSRADTAYVGVHIEGIPHLLVNRTPVDQDGVAWTAPTDANGYSYTVTECLRLRDGLTSVESTWKPKEGVSEGGAFTLEVVAVNSTIRQLFADELATANRTRITSDIELQGSGLLDFDVESTADFAASGFLYRGRETMRYGTKTATTFGDGTTTNMKRGCFNWQSDSILKRKHRTNQDNYKKPLYVSDHPARWRGRRVTVFLWQADEYGRCYDDAYKGDHEIEIRSGFINDISLADSWNEFHISCHDLTRVLTNNIGLPTAKGTLDAADGFDMTMYVQEALELRVIADTFYADAAAASLGISNVDVNITVDDDSGDPATGFMTHEQLAGYIAQSVQDAINANGYANSIVATGSSGWAESTSGTSEYSLESVKVTFENGTSPAWYNVQIRCKHGRGTVFDIPGPDHWWWSGSFYSGAAPSSSTDGHQFADGAWLEKATMPGRSSIGPEDTSIIVYPVADDGVVAEFPSSGFVRISQGDKAEIAKYTTTSTSGVPDGAIQLGGMTRGMFGSTPQTFIAWEFDNSDNDTVYNEEIAAEAFVGWDGGKDGTALSSIVLQIMLSTGGGHVYHGEYDEVARECGLAIDPAAINIEAFEACEPLTNAFRRLVVSDETTFEQFIRDEMILNGVSIGAFTDRSGRYRLNPIQVAYPLAHVNRAGFSTTNGILAADDIPTMSQNTGKLISAIKATLGRDPVTNESIGDTVNVVDAGTREDAGEGETLKLSIPGFVNDPRAELTDAAYQIFRTWGTSVWLITVALARDGLTLNPGDAVDLTVSGIWRNDGTTGLSAVPVTLINNRKNWISDAQEPGAIAQFAMWPTERGFAPWFQVETYAGTPSTAIDIEDNVYTREWDTIPNPSNYDGYVECRDWMHGPANGDTYGVRLWCQGDYANAVQRDVTGTSTDGRWTLSAALPAGWTSAAYTILCEFDDYDSGNITSEQAAYSFIAGASQVLGVSDDPHTWA